MQGLADGYFVIPYTIGDYLSEEIRTKAISTDHEAFVKAEAEVQERINKLKETMAKLDPVVRDKFKMKQAKMELLPYTYDENSQIVRIMPSSAPGLKSGKNSKSSSVDAMLGNWRLRKYNLIAHKRAFVPQS